MNKVGVWAEVYIQCRRAIRQLMFGNMTKRISALASLGYPLG